MKRRPLLLCILVLTAPIFGQVQINKDPEPDLHSPVMIDLDAQFQQHLDSAVFDKWFPVTGLKPFYVDATTLTDPEVRLHLKNRTHVVTVELRFNVYVRENTHDKILDFDYFLVRQPSLVDHIEGGDNVWAMKVEEGHPKKRWTFTFPFKPGVLGVDDDPKIRIVIAVDNI